jgi:azurin
VAVDAVVRGQDAPRYFAMLLLGVICFTTLCLGATAKDRDLNVAKPDTHEYVKPELGREGIRRADHKVNEARVYNFYARQAEHYMKNPPGSVLIPAFPGLDAGKHGHWGKYNQNGHKDGRWNDMRNDGVVGAHVNFPKATKLSPIEGGIIVGLGKDAKYHAVFWPRTLTWQMIWQDGTFHYDGFRWGTSRGATIQGKPLLTNRAGTPDDATYHGYYLHDGEPIFSYTLGGAKVLDSMRAGSLNTLDRHIAFQSKAEQVKIPVADGVEVVELKDDGRSLHLKGGGVASIHVAATQCRAALSVEKGAVSLVVSEAGTGAGVTLSMTLEPVNDGSKFVDSAATLTSRTAGGKPVLKQHHYQASGTLADDDNAYVVDDIDIPFDNRQKSLMFFTGIDFNADGEAFLCTLMGEVWKVSGLTKDLKEVHWQKVASGLNQPFGLRIWDEKVHVLERTRITAMQDLNGDGEFDFFENINNEIPLRARSHTHKFGLEKDLDGNFWFVNDTTLITVDGKTNTLRTVAYGVRNCMGVGVTRDGAVLFGPQEGTNTPGTEIIEVRDGEFYGHKRPGHIKDPVASPMAYIPRGVDNSVGGFFHVDDDRFGPLGKSILGLSYGYGHWYQVLREKAGDRTHGATIPMDGQFFAGVVRAATNPKDGQLYTVGLDGWGDYSTQDGCFHRVRYTGKPLYKPTGYKIHYNGIRLDFPVKLDARGAKDARNYFAQMWDYVNSKQYGSPEYSVSQPHKLGHDPLEVTRVELLNGGKSVFVEIPRLQPVMQMHLHMKLKAADGTAFSSDIFPTIVALGEMHELAGAQDKVLDKRTVFVLRTEKEKAGPLNTTSGEKDEHARKIVVDAVNGMKFNTKEIRVKAGESVALILNNRDGMPHNLVIAAPGHFETVGMTAFKMLNRPDAAKLHYVPEIPEVVASTFIVQPTGSHTVYFKVPDKEGEYSFLCTFPGHWQLMNGKFIVE